MGSVARGEGTGVLKQDDSRNQQKHGAVTLLHAFMYAQKLAVQGIANKEKLFKKCLHIKREPGC
jgi:hypothetical protein